MEVKLDNILPQKYKEYGDMINKSRAFPSASDGLKIVARRVLYTSFLEASKKLTKSAKVVGSTMGKFHPHGDASIYETLVNLTHCGFYDTQGSFGTLIGLEPVGDKTLVDLAAAMRYTEVRLKPTMNQLIFNLIKFVPFIESEAGEEKEPVYLPTMLPLCYISPKPKLNKCMGFGVNATYPTYKFGDLLKRLLWLIGKRKTEPIIKPYYGRFIEVLSKDKDLRKLLKTGSGTILFKPKTRIISKSELQILSRPLNINLRKKLFALFNEELTQGRLFINDLSKNMETDIRLIVSGSKLKITDIIQKLDKALTVSINYSPVFVDGDTLIRLSVDDMLLRVFNNFEKLWKAKIDYDVSLIKEKIKDLELIAKLRPHIASILPKRFQYKRQVEELHKLSKIPMDDIKRLLSKYSIKTLLTVSTDKSSLEKELKETANKRTKVKELYVSLTDINLD